LPGIGGSPIALGIAIAPVAAILAPGGTWKKLIGNKLVPQYKKQNVLDRLGETSASFWCQTRDAFRKGAEQVEDDWQKEIKLFREKVKHSDSEALLKTLQAEINNTREAAQFFQAFSEKVQSRHSGK
jgi:hypothetical protein